ncbi:hypothetical protein FXO37_01979 [Capsicum annuum]|nr:hypothetical protein FXO37_01979 [Capsicum annuum]
MLKEVFLQTNDTIFMLVGNNNIINEWDGTADGVVKDIIDFSKVGTGKTSGTMDGDVEVMRFQHSKVKGTWSLVPFVPHAKPVGCKWVFRVKYNSDGSIGRYKARLVAKGYLQRPGVDYFETYSLVAKHTTMRVVLSLAFSKDLPLRQLDVNNAFLHGHLSEEVYMSQPPGFVNEKFPNHICRLHKAIYGLNQGPRAWYDELKAYLVSLGFHHSQCDQSHTIQDYRWKLAVLVVYSPRCCFYVNKLSQFTSCPTTTHWTMVKRVLRYLAGTSDRGLFLRKDSPLLLHAFSDSDWAGDRDDRSSTTGYVVFLCSHPVSWISKKQRAVTRSSTEAEYRAIASTSAELCWVRNLLKELSITPTQPPPPVIYCDNLGANPVFLSRMKHLELDYHFVRKLVQQGLLRVSHVSSKDQLADMLTKSLPRSSFELLCSKIGVADAVVCDPSSSNGAGVSSATGHLYPDPDSVQSVPGSTLAPPALLQFAKSRKLSVERSDPKKRLVVMGSSCGTDPCKKPMALEQVLSDQDSEDEVDDDVADFEDRRANGQFASGVLQ